MVILYMHYKNNVVNLHGPQISLREKYHFWGPWCSSWSLFFSICHDYHCEIMTYNPKYFITYDCSWRRKWHPTPVFLPGKSHGWRSLVGCSPWGRWQSDTTEQLHFHFSLSRIGEGNGNPLQCSCLENPRDGGAWWAAVYGVAQSQTRLKRLSSSSSSMNVLNIHSCDLLYLFLAIHSSHYPERYLCWCMNM